MSALHASRLKNIECPWDLAKRLHIDPRALSYVTLVSPTKECKRSICSFPSATYNYGYCICCSQKWFPRKKIAYGRKGNGDRGNRLLGPAFQRCASPNVPSRTACCCNCELCYGMGYTDSVFSFPTDVVIRQQWYAAMESRNLKIYYSKRKNQIDINHRKLCLAWWHFSPEHLEKDGARYKIKRQGSYKDNTGKEWFTPNHPPPNYDTLTHFHELENLALSKLHSLHSVPWWTVMKCVPPTLEDLKWENESLNDKLQEEKYKTKEWIQQQEKVKDDLWAKNSSLKIENAAAKAEVFKLNKVIKALRGELKKAP